MSIGRLEVLDNKWLDGLFFCSEAYRIFEEIRAEEGGVSTLRMLASDEAKKLLEEILPICKYIQSVYRAGEYLSVKWMSGSQGYDAEIKVNGFFNGDDESVESGFIGVTCAVHKNDYLSRELIEREGFAFDSDGLSRRKDGEIESTPLTKSSTDFLRAAADRVLERIKKKSEIKYPRGTILIIALDSDELLNFTEWGVLRELV